jgi:ribosomal protein S12 methylthiotransferase accessory factor
MGITRLANVTGLDSIGIPVYMACRPLSRSISVSQGKGLTAAEAKVSAFMEAAESYHAEAITAPLKLASFTELQRDHPVIDVTGLPRSRLGNFDPQQQILWVEGQSLNGGGASWVPLELVSTNYTLPQPQGSFAFPANTNGLASGNTLAEAALHALCELVERDALALWRLGGEAARAASRIDPASVDSPSCRTLLQLYAEAGLDIGIWDATSDTAVPVLCCAVAERSEHAVEAELGAGCHPDREIALLRALTEAAQSRTTRIAGSRDDFVPESYDSPAKLARNRAARRWLSDPLRLSFADLPNFGGETIGGDLEGVLARLRDLGIDQIVMVDLSKPDIALPVVRVVASGLEGAYQGAGSDYRPGPRARARGLATDLEDGR